MIDLTERFIEAFQYAAEIHTGQKRKGSKVPYLVHLMSVSAMVIEDGGDEDEAIAALLHDSLEDHPDRTSPEEIRRRFGDKVLQLVIACTDTPADYRGGPKPDWRMRKESYLAHLRDGMRSDMRIALADKLHNARSMLEDYRRQGESLWSRFNVGKAEQLWYYRSLVEAFEHNSAHGPLFDEFKRVVTELERITEDSGKA
jgi:(p)ppGpp synthase/HD superfamily hydrolase